MIAQIAAGIGRIWSNSLRNARRLAGAILTCWSLVHGLTLLMVDGLVGPREKSDKICEGLVQGLIEGLETTFPSLPPGAWVGHSVAGSSLTKNVTWPATIAAAGTPSR